MAQKARSKISQQEETLGKRVLMKIDNEKDIEKKTKKSKKQRSNRRGSSYSEDDGDN
jgi:hypothetical protein